MIAAEHTLPSISPVVEEQPVFKNKLAGKKADHLHNLSNLYKEVYKERFDEIRNKTGLAGMRQLNKALKNPLDTMNAADIHKAQNYIVLHNYFMSSRYLLENKDFFEQQNANWNELAKNMANTVNILNEYLSEDTLDRPQKNENNTDILRCIKEEIENCLHENADKLSHTKDIHAKFTNFLERSHISTLTPIFHFFRIACSTICYGIRLVVSAVNKNPTVATFVHALNILSFALLIPRLLKHVVRLVQCAREGNGAFGEYWNEYKYEIIDNIIWLVLNFAVVLISASTLGAGLILPPLTLFISIVLVILTGNCLDIALAVHKKYADSKRDQAIIDILKQTQVDTGSIAFASLEKALSSIEKYKLETEKQNIMDIMKSTMATFFGLLATALPLPFVNILLNRILGAIFNILFGLFFFIWGSHILAQWMPTIVKKDPANDLIKKLLAKKSEENEDRNYKEDHNYQTQGKERLRKQEILTAMPQPA